MYTMVDSTNKILQLLIITQEIIPPSIQIHSVGIYLKH